MNAGAATFMLATLMVSSMTTGAESAAANSESASRLIVEIQKLIPLRRESVEKFFGVRFVTVRKDESMTFLRAYNVSHSGFEVSELDLRLSSTRALADMLVVSLQSPCITRQEFRSHLSAERIPDTNAMLTPSPFVYDRYARTWGELRLGYHKESNCLVHIVFALGKE